MLKKIVLDPMRRGEPFKYSSFLTSGWLATMFPGGFVFTLRTDVPPSTQLDDTDLASSNGGSGVIDQATSQAGAIVFSDSTNFSVLIPSARTRLWPLGRALWDMKGIVSTPNDIEVLAYGDLSIYGDVTRVV